MTAACGIHQGADGVWRGVGGGNLTQRGDPGVFETSLPVGSGVGS